MQIILFLILVFTKYTISNIINNSDNINYYIINLGNTIDNMYHYTIIYSFDNNELNIISRNISEYNNKYNSNICNILYEYKLLEMFQCNKVNYHTILV